MKDTIQRHMTSTIQSALSGYHDAAQDDYLTSNPTLWLNIAFHSRNSEEALFLLQQNTLNAFKHWSNIEADKKDTLSRSLVVFFQTQIQHIDTLNEVLPTVEGLDSALNWQVDGKTAADQLANVENCAACVLVLSLGGKFNCDTNDTASIATLIIAYKTKNVRAVTQLGFNAQSLFYQCDPTTYQQLGQAVLDFLLHTQELLPITTKMIWGSDKPSITETQLLLKNTPSEGDAQLYVLLALLAARTEKDRITVFHALNALPGETKSALANSLIASITNNKSFSQTQLLINLMNAASKQKSLHAVSDYFTQYDTSWEHTLTAIDKVTTDDGKLKVLAAFHSFNSRAEVKIQFADILILADIDTRRLVIVGMIMNAGLEQKESLVTAFHLMKSKEQIQALIDEVNNQGSAQVINIASRIAHSTPVYTSTAAGPSTAGLWQTPHETAGGLAEEKVNGHPCATLR